MSIKLVVDSASDIDEEEAKSLGIEMIPMTINFADSEYLDGVNLSHREFFEKLIESADLPKTSQINEFRFEEAFEKYVSKGDEVIAITLSSKLSGTYSSAEKAGRKFKDKVSVVDSLNASIGERILIMLALRLIKEGNSKDKIIEILEKKKRDIKVLAVLDTLKYLKKGGRISAVTAFAGEMLSIKPVITIEKGEVKMAGKAVGPKKANNLLMQLINGCHGIDFDLPYAVGYSGLSDEVLQKYLQDSSSLWKNKTDNVPSFMIGSTIGTHVGPGAVAVAFFANQE